jgi:Uma2 family endonuclease
VSTRIRSGPYSFGDFIELIREDQKADLIDGAIYMASPENTEHNDLLGWLHLLLRGFVRQRHLGRVTVNKVAYRLSEKTGPEPDLAFVRAARADIIKEGYVDGPPDLAVGIVSPDSVNRDYEDKRVKYERSGVEEYWIIDPEEQKATFLVRGPSGYIESPPERNIYRSRVLPGFNLDTRWFWERPLPPELPILQSLLADAPR